MRRTVAHVLDELGGVASRRELEGHGLHPELITMALAMGRIWRARRGVYVTAGMPEPLIRAVRIGGRLACVSALQFWGEPTAPDDRLHVEVRANASRLRLEERTLLHWTRRPDGTSRTIVDRETARRQAAVCAVARGASL